MTQVVSSLAVLRDNLALNGVHTAQEMALLPTVIAMQGAMNDFALAGIKWQDNTLDSVLFGILTTGTPMQRAALARHLPIESGFYMPCIDIMLKANGSAGPKFIEFIKQNLQVLASHYGVSVNGDADSIAFTIINDYGGFSLIDFNTFFEGAKSGRWRDQRKSEYQHIATRGINYEYLLGWLEDFANQRDEARNSAYELAKSLPNTLQAGGSAETFAAMTAKREDDVKAKMLLEERVRMAYEDWERELQVSTVKTIGPDWRGNYIEIPVRQYTDDGVRKKYVRTVYDYIYFGEGKEAGKIAASLERYEMQRQMSEFTTIKKYMDADKLLTVICADMAKHAKVRPYAAQKTAGETMHEITKAFYEIYLPMCAQEQKVYPGLPKADFIFQTALKMYTQHFGENPIKHIFYAKQTV